MSLVAVGIKFKPSVEAHRECASFAVACLHTVNYAQRGQIDADKVERDIFYGKLAEVAVNEALAIHGEIDFRIYEGKRKSHNADIVNGRLGDWIVKSSLMGTPFALSWSFEAGDHIDPFLRSTQPHNIALVSIYPDSLTCMVHLPIRAAGINLPFRQPFKRSLRKAVLYYEDVVSLPSALELDTDMVQAYAARALPDFFKFEESLHAALYTGTSRM